MVVGWEVEHPMQEEDDVIVDKHISLDNIFRDKTGEFVSLQRYVSLRHQNDPTHL